MDCIFCEIAGKRIPANVVYEDEEVIAILDVNPVSEGHTLVMPKKHAANTMECDGATVGRVYGVASAIAKQYMKDLGADGINILSNAGLEAGQTVDHFHVHVIPRYKDKTKDKLDIHFGSIKA